MNKWKNLFMAKSLLGRKTDLKNPQAVIDMCARLAYKDMLDGGRFYLYKRNLSNEGKDIQNEQMSQNCQKMIATLEKYHYSFSREIIGEVSHFFGNNEIISNGKSHVTKFGLAQKFVNMTFKYLYIFSDYIGKDIDFSKCDCPLDSIILGEIPEIKTQWTKISEEEYYMCQKIIEDKLHQETLDDELRELGNMAYDFLHW